MARFLSKAMFSEITRRWHTLTLYQRFEQVVALVLTAMISLVVVVAMVYLVINVFHLLVVRAGDPFDYRVFQGVFEMILTVLIALEFNHTIVQAMEQRKSIIQVKSVLLIALLVLVRKFIVLDPDDFDPLLIGSLALAVLTIGVVYWLMRERDDRIESSGGEGHRQP